MQIQQIPTDQLKPNGWNPNRMSDDELAEFKAEVEHLGRLPKPIEVRSNCDGRFEIIDGEHGWRVATELGFAEVPCEVQDVDDFEAMRQTYKRNQSGTHDKVLEGRMFRAMMEDRGLSRRQLGKEIGVDEKTIRNSVRYADVDDKLNAEEVRNGSAVIDVGQLPVRTVQVLGQLPPRIGRWWIDDCDADPIELFGGNHDRREFRKARPGGKTWRIKHRVARLKQIEESGILEIISLKRFDLERAETFFDEEVEIGLSAETLPEFRRHMLPFYQLKQCHLSRTAETLMAEDGSYLLTPEEIKQTLENALKAGSSYRDIWTRLRMAITDKGLPEPPLDNSAVLDWLWQNRFDNEAPEYLRELDIPAESKLTLFKAIFDEWDEPDVVQQVATQFDWNDSPGARFHHARQAVERAQSRAAELEEELALSEDELQQQLAERLFKLFNRDEEFTGLAESIVEKLASVFDKRELHAINLALGHRLHFIAMTDMLRATLGR